MRRPSATPRDGGWGLADVDDGDATDGVTDDAEAASSAATAAELSPELRMSDDEGAGDPSASPRADAADDAGGADDAVARSSLAPNDMDKARGDDLVLLMATPLDGDGVATPGLGCTARGAGLFKMNLK